MDHSDDPTLASCCAKDAAEAAAAERLRCLLSRTDPARVATSLRTSVVGVCETDDAFVDQQDSNSALSELRAARYAELRRAAFSRGVVKVGEESLPALCASHTSTLVHFPLPGYEDSDAMDELLDKLTRRRRTDEWCVVKIVPATKRGSATLRAAGCCGPPAVVLFVGDRLAALSAGYQTFGEENRERGLRRWLKAAGDPVSVCGSDSDTDGDDEEVLPTRRGAAGTRADVSLCECGRTYAHTHVRALRSSGLQAKEDDH